MKIVEIDDRDFWDKFVIKNGGHPLQLWGWGQLKAKHGNWKIHRIVFQSDENDKTGEVLCASQILERKFPGIIGRIFGSMFYIPRGPIFNSNCSELDSNFLDSRETLSGEIIAKLCEYAKQHRAFVIKFEPQIRAQTPTNADSSLTVQDAHNSLFKDSRTNILLNNTVTLKLLKTEEELFTTCSKSCRKYIRKSAVACNITQVTDSESEYFTEFLKVYKETSKRANFNLHSDQYYKDVFNEMKDNCLLYVATPKEDSNNVVAFLMNVHTNTCEFELYGGVNELGQKLRANYNLKWHAIINAKNRGLKIYDMNGLVSDGVNNFKLQFINNDKNDSTKWIKTQDIIIRRLGYLGFETFLPIIKRIMKVLKK